MLPSLTGWSFPYRRSCRRQRGLGQYRPWRGAGGGPVTAAGDPGMGAGRGRGRVVSLNCLSPTSADEWRLVLAWPSCSLYDHGGGVRARSRCSARPWAGPSLSGGRGADLEDLVCCRAAFGLTVPGRPAPGWGRLTMYRPGPRQALRGSRRSRGPRANPGGPRRCPRSGGRSLSAIELRCAHPRRASSDGTVVHGAGRCAPYAPCAPGSLHQG